MIECRNQADGLDDMPILFNQAFIARDRAVSLLDKLLVFRGDPC